MARSLHKTRKALEEGWQDAQTVSFANTGIKHAVIAMADVVARAAHAGIRTLRLQALSIGICTHGQGLATLTKESSFPVLVSVWVTLARWWRSLLPATTRLWRTVLFRLVSIGISPPRVESER